MELLSLNSNQKIINNVEKINQFLSNRNEDEEQEEEASCDED